MAGAVVFAIPGDLATLSGGYGYDRRIMAELRGLGWDVRTVGLGEGFPRPSAGQRAHALQQLAALPAGRPVVIDGLALGALPEIPAGPIVALVHHPLAYETGLTREDSAALHRSERAALAKARLVIATSRTTAAALIADYGVPGERIEVVVPGTDRAAFATGSDGSLRLLSVGAIVPRKGFDLLVEASSGLADLDWHLTIAGARRDADAVARLEASIARQGLQARVHCVGAIVDAELARLYAGADLFVLASRYEGYGMAYAEAIAHGLPVIGTTGGAIAEVVPASAGRLVPPGDVAALAAALREVIGQAPLRQAMAAGARAAAASLPTWPDSGRRFASVLQVAVEQGLLA